jgi:nucleotide-binding universal stress UspA family protein
MTTSAVLILTGLAWLAIGLLTGLLMARRGHSWFAWTLLGTVLGPLVVPLVLLELRSEGGLRDRVLETGSAGTGNVDVLVGIDGSPESRAVIAEVIRVMHPGRLTLAAVLELGSERTPAGLEDERRATAELEAAAASAPRLSPELVLLRGAPADALRSYAEEQRFDVLAVGTRGRGASKVLLGSVASGLAQRSPIPVLLVPGDEND